MDLDPDDLGDPDVVTKAEELEEVEVEEEEGEEEERPAWSKEML